MPREFVIEQAWLKTTSDKVVVAATSVERPEHPLSDKCVGALNLGALNLDGPSPPPPPRPVSLLPSSRRYVRATTTQLHTFQTLPSIGDGLPQTRITTTQHLDLEGFLPAFVQNKQGVSQLMRLSRMRKRFDQSTRVDEDKRRRLLGSSSARKGRSSTPTPRSRRSKKAWPLSISSRRRKRRKKQSS